VLLVAHRGSDRVLGVAPQAASDQTALSVYVLGVDLAAIPGATTPSRAVWELAMRASAA
jgi:hypothetical protein